MRQHGVEPDLPAAFHPHRAQPARLVQEGRHPALQHAIAAGLDPRLHAVRQIEPVGEQRQRVGPVAQQHRRMQRRRARIQQPQPPARHLVAVAIGTVDHRLAPAFGKARNRRKLVGDAIGEDDPAPDEALAARKAHHEVVAHPANAHRLGRDVPGRRIGQHIGQPGTADVERRHAIEAEDVVRRGRVAVARLTGVDERHPPPRPHQMHGRRQSRKASPDDDRVVHTVLAA